MKRHSKIAALALVALTAFTGCGLRPSTSEVPQAAPGSLAPVEGAEGVELTVGSKNFTEQLILGKMAVLIAQAAGFDVTDMTNIPGSSPARALMISGDVDMEWEYTGTAWLSYMGEEKGIPDQQQQWQAVHDADLKNGLTWGAPAPMNNTYGLAARSDFAQEMGITTMSDLAKLPVEERTICTNAEFLSRSDGMIPMLEVYELPRGAADGVPESNLATMDSGAVYTGIDSGSCNFGIIFTTDGRIPALNLTVLEDDRKFFPAYNGAPVINTEVLTAYPELADRFEQVGATLTDDVMRELNYKVDVEGQDPALVAFDYMVQQGFITEP